MDPPSARGLTRPPEPRASSRVLSPEPPPPHSSNGVVVVGFISRRPDDSSQLINRVLDSNVFGSGSLDKILTVDCDEAKEWFERRRISYYHEEEKGVLFLQFSATRCPAFDGLSDPILSGFDSVYEEREVGDLQGLLFMFSVCHVVIYIQERSCFDSQILKNFRVLQAAKQALAPYMKSRFTPPLPSRVHSSFLARPSVSTGSSPARGGILSRNASYASLLPGQCSPVMLFVFVDDFSDLPNSSFNSEESTNTSSFNQSSNLSGLTRPAVRSSSSVVVLARPGSKSEVGLRKKLQSSLEAQIRFLIKKCRTLSGSETGHTGSRTGGISGTTPLFSLDSSKIVVLLDRSTNQTGASLEFATSLVEDILNGKANPDSLLLETCSNGLNGEDVLAVKDFIYRQSDVLRGRGGLAASSSSGSGHGVGMVAVAAAAAAASASGKASATPELPSFDVWLSHSQVILLGVIAAKGGRIDDLEVEKRRPRQRNAASAQVEGISSKGVDSLDIAVSWLRSGKGLNMKFSTLLCERSLPAAREVYLKDLPACYPTSVHETHLQKALHAFNSIVRGTSVEVFTKRLEDECMSIWKSGRQLCDAVSLTGKPCIHQRHDVGIGGSPLGEAAKPHSSGYVFLHACACGRSRRLCSDPFDFESANRTFNCFPDCDNVLPNVNFPLVSTQGPISSASWSLICVGSAKYYEPSRGLLQSGFCTSQKFLLKWTIYLEKQSVLNNLQIGTLQQDSEVVSSMDSQVAPKTVGDITKAGATDFSSGDMRTEYIIHGKSVENGKVEDNGISFGRGLSNVRVKKPFSEVVAGLATTDSAFPPLQQSKQLSYGLDKRIKQKGLQAQSLGPVQAGFHQGSKKPERILSHQEISKEKIGIGGMDGDPVFRIGSSVVPMNMNDGAQVRSNAALSHVTAYVGFEHECPCGHRFLLNKENLSLLGFPYAMPEESGVTLSLENSNGVVSQPKKFEKSAGYGKGRRKSSRMSSSLNKLKNIDKPRQMAVRGNLETKEQNQTSITAATPELAKGLETHFQSVKLVDNECAFSMLNGNLPIFMNCPHCLGAEKAHSDIKFAGAISQLRRIFMVTPPFPVVLATCPVIQFQESCLPPSEPDREQKLRFSLGCPVILPPKSFLALRLPFIYGVQLENGTLLPLNPLEQEPEKTAWIAKGTALQIVSKESGFNGKCHK